jgi:hypothetical protein
MKERKGMEGAGRRGGRRHKFSALVQKDVV